MRVVAGTAKGRRLQAPKGANTRPTSDRVREAIFNALGSLDAVEGATVADLFAGSGAIGIEALSRGAVAATFVDVDHRAYDAIKANLATTGFEGTLVLRDVESWVRSAPSFDVVFADPPYLFDGWPHLFEQQGRTLNKLLAAVNTIVLIFSSLTMALAVDASQKGNRRRVITCLAITFSCALTFMVIKAIEYTDKFGHYTMVVSENGERYVYDGHLHEHEGHKTLHGVRTKLYDDAVFNINFAGKEWIEDQAKSHHAIGSGEKLEEKEYQINGEVAQQVNYGPWKNLFFSCYFGRDDPAGNPDGAGEPQENFSRGHRIRRPLLAFRRSGLDIPVPADVLDLTQCTKM